MSGDEGHQGGNIGTPERSWLYGFRSPSFWAVASKHSTLLAGIRALLRWEGIFLLFFFFLCLFTCVSSDPVCVVRDLGSVLLPSEPRRFTARVRRWHQQLAYLGSDLDEIGSHRMWMVMGPGR